jgi:hypothetical protein
MRVIGSGAGTCDCSPFATHHHGKDTAGLQNKADLMQHPRVVAARWLVGPFTECT